MPVSIIFRCTLVATACFGLTACSTFNQATGRVAGLVTPYKVEVVQGNFVSKEQKQALQLGMPRAQVRDILGSPLIASAFHADRWDYVFTIRRQGQEPQLRKLSVFFKGNDLAQVESDELISEQEFVSSLSTNRPSSTVPVLEVPREQLPAPSAASQPSSAVASPAATNAPTRVYPPLETAVRP
jgi:outer membrane protein assembly factor BamE